MQGYFLRYEDRDYDERLASQEMAYMTLTYGLIADGGIILIADSQVTHKHRDGSRILGTYENTRSKIRRLANGGAFSIAGNGGFADALLEKARTINTNGSFAETVFAYSEVFGRENQRLYGERDLPMRPHADFLFCGYSGEAVPQIVQLSSQWDFGCNYVATGSGYGFSGAREHGAVMYLHHRFYRPDMPLERAKLLAYCIIAETADLDNTVGGPVEMVIVTKNGVEPFTEEERYEQKRQQFIKQVKAFFD
jgi:20S proteasome alpha/beta subunit